ncbi:g_PROTEIN_RECEP_F1_2 domain-containing protein [Nephila pilipes]|uniref:G_PROTEIN_RECEP_F1_2 domain-containing protein n=1 Tax=Nephila pilipes TaxID=299642 RepID=A0A8X6NNB4_NEPPI|nr:g_PROTEIN_RECEP_F1_2 domain-containing protein [Nephila pilipes]
MAIVLLPLAGFGLYYKVDDETGAYICARYRHATAPADVAYAYLMFGFGTTMCVVIVSCNLAVVSALCRLSPSSSKARRTTVSRDHRELAFNHTTQEELSFAKLMVVLCVFFVVCWLPQMRRPPYIKAHCKSAVCNSMLTEPKQCANGEDKT